MDIWSKEKRSLVMSKIRGINTKPEILLRSALFRQGFRFRIHRKDLPGKPDIVFPKLKIAIFVHGCFWHYHNDCPEGRIPRTNSKFWSTKLKGNVARDLEHNEKLIALGWKVIIVWECEIEKKLNGVLRKLMLLLNKRVLALRLLKKKPLKKGALKWNTQARRT